mmetsp:Transcript_50623/g.127155  ORF Transcript_50623/g.127155 Transcript_50623/m.127155 type:complete len:185 (+) Transcript_50623:986-1540(+)
MVIQCILRILLMVVLLLAATVVLLPLVVATVAMLRALPRELLLATALRQLASMVAQQLARLLVLQRAARTPDRLLVRRATMALQRLETTLPAVVCRLVVGECRLVVVCRLDLVVVVWLVPRVVVVVLRVVVLLIDLHRIMLLLLLKFVHEHSIRLHLKTLTNSVSTLVISLSFTTKVESGGKVN